MIAAHYDIGGFAMSTARVMPVGAKAGKFAG
jgi:hypothetical protein